MNLLFIITYVVWLLTELFLNRLTHSKTTDKQNADKNSLRLIWITIVIAITAAVYISARFYFPIFSNPLYQYVGLAVIYIGIIFRFVAIYTLGKFFTVDVTIRQGHQLKKDGLYKYLRHPSYFASLVSFIGFGISLNNWVSLALITIAIFIVFVVRIKIEERVLSEHFGEEYSAYKKTTKAIIPFVY